MARNYAEKMLMFENGIVERKTVTDVEQRVWSESDKCEEYQSVYRFANEDLEKSKIKGPLFFDLDTDLSTRKQYHELKRQVRKLYNCFAEWKIKPSEIELYFSGFKGFHFIVPAEVLKIGYSEDLNSVNKFLAETLKNTYGVSLLDTGIYDKRRLLRVPGSINYKSKLYKIPLSFDEFDKISLKQLKELAKTQPKKRETVKYSVNQNATEAFRNYVRKFRSKQKRDTKKKECAPKTLSSEQNLLPCIEYALRNDCPVGKRDKTAFLIASFFLQRKTDIATIKEALSQWNKKLTEPLHHMKLYHIVNDAVKNDAKNKNHYGCGVFQSEGLCLESCSLKQSNRAA